VAGVRDQCKCYDDRKNLVDLVVEGKGKGNSVAKDKGNDKHINKERGQLAEVEDKRKGDEEHEGKSKGNLIVERSRTTGRAMLSMKTL